MKAIRCRDCGQVVTDPVYLTVDNKPSQKPIHQECLEKRQSRAIRESFIWKPGRSEGKDLHDDNMNVEHQVADAWWEQQMIDEERED